MSYFSDDITLTQAEPRHTPDVEQFDIAAAELPPNERDLEEGEEDGDYEGE